MKKKNYIELSRTQLFNAIVKGWKTLAYTRGKYFGDKDGHAIDYTSEEDVKKIKCACGIGAAAYVLKVDPDSIITEIPTFGIDIITISDGARSKVRALKAIRNAIMLEWPAGVKMRIYTGAARY